MQKETHLIFMYFFTVDRAISGHEGITLAWRCLEREYLIHLCPWKGKSEVSLDEKQERHSRFPWWIGPLTEINWIDAKDPRGAWNCPGVAGAPPPLLEPLAASWNQASLICAIRSIKMCWLFLLKSFCVGNTDISFSPVQFTRGCRGGWNVGAYTKSFTVNKSLWFCSWRF